MERENGMSGLAKFTPNYSIHFWADIERGAQRWKEMIYSMVIGTSLQWDRKQINSRRKRESA